MSVLDDLKQAWRRLRQRPALTTVAVATLGLALGANIAIFTLIHALAIQPLPVRDPSASHRIRGAAETAVRHVRPRAGHWRGQSGEPAHCP
jgi:macrolide transport system ATP-binding/permease protein